MKDWEGMDRNYLGGPFDRQVRIQDWNQKKVEEQSVLVLGVGGLGSIVTINMLRLGVGKLFLVDYDVVDIHNLNRQLLYSHADVGKPKVEAAFKNAAFHNAGNTQIEYFHGNALTNWDKIVQFAKRSTFVYNCIDWGDKFDAAVSSLCLQLKLPLVMGGTFSISLTVDFFPQNGTPCFVCLDDTTRLYPQLADIVPQKIMQYKDISFLPKNNNPIGRSSVIVCTICGEFMSSIFLNWLFLVQKKLLKTSRTFFYHNTFEFIKFEDLQICKDCPFCKKYHPPTPEQAVQEIKINSELEPVLVEQIKKDPDSNQNQPSVIAEVEKKQ